MLSMMYRKATMKRQLAHLPEIKLVGITVRTNNTNEMNPLKAKIGELARHYWQDGLAKHIPNRVQSGKTYSVYTDYESDERGDYTYFMGEEVASFEGAPENFAQLTLPATCYAQFTTPPGAIPDVIIGAWRQIWMMGEQNIGGKRAYKADFEVIDVNTTNPEMAVFDIFVGLQ